MFSGNYSTIAFYGSSLGSLFSSIPDVVKKRPGKETFEISFHKIIKRTISCFNTCLFSASPFARVVERTFSSALSPVVNSLGPFRPFELFKSKGAHP